MSEVKAKLDKYLDFWIEHNKEHANEFLKWSQKIEEENLVEVSEYLKKAAEQITQSSQYLIKAKEKLKGSF